MEENQIVELVVDGLGSSGEGVGKIDGFTVFADGALTGEKVKVKLKKVKKHYAVGSLVEILEASKDRVEPVCPVYYKCGGCQLQHLSYEGQLREKKQQVYDALTRIGHLEDFEIYDTIGAKNPLNYRNKMQFPVATNNEGAIKIGCYAKASHYVIDVDNCYIQDTKNNDIIKVVRKWMNEYKILPYNERNHRGLVRHVMGRVGEKTGDVMVVLVVTKRDIPHMRELIKMLKAGVPGVKSIIQNINKKTGNVILGGQNRVLFGKPTIKDKIGNLKFNISAPSFFQVNTKQAESLYKVALEYANLTGKETVVDVYCGTGTITLFLAQKAKKVYGIEIVEEAVFDAQKNADQNRIENADFLLGDASRTLEALVETGVNPDVILLDPPRAGCEQSVLDTIAKVAPKKVVYVSCNPASLARDLKVLSDNGYKVNKVQPVDMFHETHHIETVVLLTRVEK
jgi:23S rRNA (uracil1939-C5)-methyltransferase